MTPKQTDSDQIRIIGKNIDRLMHRNRINQSELSKIIGVSESAVGKWVLGKNAPSMGNVQKMADYFGVKMAYILEENYTDELNHEKQFLMDKIAKADERKLNRIKKLMELIEDEESRNW